VQYYITPLQFSEQNPQGFHTHIHDIHTILPHISRFASSFVPPACGSVVFVWARFFILGLITILWQDSTQVSIIIKQLLAFQCSNRFLKPFLSQCEQTVTLPKTALILCSKCTAQFLHQTSRTLPHIQLGLGLGLVTVFMCRGARSYSKMQVVYRTFEMLLRTWKLYLPS